VVHGIERHAWRQRRRGSGRGRKGNSIYLGFISAQQGLFPEIGASASERRSLATALYPILGFIADRARSLGYVP
jgi:hypothetical protein